jgi:hypothetical protein
MAPKISKSKPVAKPVMKPAAKIGKKAKTNGKMKLNTSPKNCVGGFPGCKSCIGDYMDVDGEGYCDSCDKYIDQNPWDAYWEHMHNDFGESKEYKELEKAGLVEDSDAYDKARGKYVKNYEKWPDMRRRMAKERKR